MLTNAFLAGLKHAAPPGYAIWGPFGQSNVFYSSTAMDPAIDVGASDIFQWGYNAPNANTIIPAVEPLDYVDTSGKAGDPGNGGVGNTIGHAMTFVRDYWKPNHAGSQKIMFAGYAYGGQALLGHFNPLGTPGYPAFIARMLAAKAAGGAGSAFKGIIWHQGEGDYQAYAGAAQPAIIDKYRALLTTLVDKARADLSVADLPFLLGQMTEWSIDAASARFSTNGINIDRIHRELVNRVEYTGIAGNGGDDTGNVHYSAVNQRRLGVRHGPAYEAALLNAWPAVTWPAIDIPVGDFVVSNGNMDITGGASSGWKTAFANGGRLTGKIYAEMEAVAVASQTNLGLAGISSPFQNTSVNIGQSAGNMSGVTPKSAGVWGGQANQVTGYTVVNAVSIGAITPTTRLRIAVDLDLGYAWIGKVGSAWPSGDPAAGTAPWISGIAERVALAVSIYTGTGNKWRIHANAGDFTGTVPTGFVPWGAA